MPRARQHLRLRARWCCMVVVAVLCVPIWTINRPMCLRHQGNPSDPPGGDPSPRSGLGRDRGRCRRGPSMDRGRRGGGLALGGDPFGVLGDDLGPGLAEPRRGGLRVNGRKPEPRLTTEPCLTRSTRCRRGSSRGCRAGPPGGAGGTGWSPSRRAGRRVVALAPASRTSATSMSGQAWRNASSARSSLPGRSARTAPGRTAAGAPRRYAQRSLTSCARCPRQRRRRRAVSACRRPPCRGRREEAVVEAVAGAGSGRAEIARQDGRVAHVDDLELREDPVEGADLAPGPGRTERHQPEPGGGDRGCRRARAARRRTRAGSSSSASAR